MPMGASHLAAAGGGYEPQRAFDWRLDLFGVPGQDIIKLAVQSFTPPGHNNDQIELPYLNSVNFVAGQARFDTVDILVRDMVDQTVFQSLKDWKHQVHDPTAEDIINLASVYKKRAEVTLLGPDEEAQRKYKLEGVWPTVLRPEALDYGSNDVYRINMTLSVDKAYYVG